MTTRLVLPSKLSPEGRATVPAAARRALGVNAGDRLVFIIEGDQVRVTSAQQLAAQVWANNHSGDAEDSVGDVRALRVAEQQTAEDALIRIEDDARQPDHRSDDHVAADLVASLGLPQ